MHCTPHMCESEHMQYVLLFPCGLEQVKSHALCRATCSKARGTNSFSFWKALLFEAEAASGPSACTVSQPSLLVFQIPNVSRVDYDLIEITDDDFVRSQLPCRDLHPVPSEATLPATVAVMVHFPPFPSSACKHRYSYAHWIAHTPFYQCIATFR
jgi:hypothetical protein